jgi:DUF2075 family protein
MIVYQSTKEKFNEDVLTGDIENIILSKYREKLKRNVPKNEVRAWQGSMIHMNQVLSDPLIPDDAGVSIECQIPQTSLRIDFILTGQNEKKQDHAIIVELKQWQSAELTDKDAIVKTRFQYGMSETNHPSYQAWSYAALLEGFNEAVYNGQILLQPCAFLHNYIVDDVIANPFYSDHIKKAPLFLKTDILKLREFIKRFVKFGDVNQILYRIQNGKVRPSKALADSLASMIKGNVEFLMIDDQKVVFEMALSLVRKSVKGQKQTLIVHGGPGTGKSVVAVNLLVAITKLKKLVQYVTKNAAPRAVYASKLTGTLNKTEYNNLFKSSGSYHESEENLFDALVVDEAHRLNEKSGMFQNLGENQVKEIIKASRCSVFFIDEDQKVTLKDIGSKDEIIKWATYLDSEVSELELSSQFRCNGSDGYLAWIDNALQIRKTANEELTGIDYEFKTVTSPLELRDIIFEKNRINNRARMVAGYCWDWKSKKDKKATDINFPEFNFHMKWNLTDDGSLWILKPESVNEIGCIHTCQGLEVDYIGVIIGPDLIVRNGEVLVDPAKRSRMDTSVYGYKKLLKDDPEYAKKLVKSIIKNTYRTLMTRGMKGCYLFCSDKETNEYFEKK